MRSNLFSYILLKGSKLLFAQAFQISTIAAFRQHIALQEGVVGACSMSVRFFQVAGVGKGIEVVEVVLRILSNEAADHVATNEAGPAGDKNVYGMQMFSERLMGLIHCLSQGNSTNRSPQA